MTSPDETSRGPVVGKVAAINSDRELVLNRGRKDGVAVGMVFRVKGTPEEIVDPDTGEVIGVVSKAKVLVKVADVDERISIARTFRSRTINVGGKGLGSDIMGNLFQPPKYEKHIETLRRSRQAGSPINPEDSIVEVGDVIEETDESEPIGSSSVWR